MDVTLDPLPGWLRYKGKWGSTVVAPALQEWCVTALLVHVVSLRTDDDRHTAMR